eukprot:71962_1
MSSLECTVAVQVVSSVFTLIVVALLWTIVFIIYIIIFDGKDYLSKTATLLRIVFITSTVIALCYYPFFRWRPCLAFNFQSLDLIFYISYGVQTVSLALLFLSLMRKIFESSSFAISKRTENIYIAICICCALLIGLLCLSVWTDAYMMKVLLSTLLMCVYIAVMISLTMLFIHKLVSVYQSTAKSLSSNATTGCSDSQSRLVTAITKLTILMALSTSITIVNTITNLLYSLTRTESMRIVANCIGVMDLFSNLVNAMLCYRTFSDYYYKICITLDSKCRVCWVNVIKDETTDMRRLSAIMESPKCKPKPARTIRQLPSISEGAMEGLDLDATENPVDLYGTETQKDCTKNET